MSEIAEKGSVPRLRFPEFQGVWRVSELNNIAHVNPNATSQLPDQFRYIDLESVEKGKLLQTRVEHRETAPSRAQRIVASKDVLFQTVRPYQKNNLLFEIEDKNVYVASTGYAQIRAHESAAFLYYALENDVFQLDVKRRCSGSSYPAIAPSDLAKINISLPLLAEQRKIAECLQSLDELIAAEMEKLEALKRHKKGLLQQLFPAEGETTPRLRFPQSRNAGDWQVHSLGEVCLFQRGFDLPSQEIRPGTIPVIYSNGEGNTHEVGMVNGPGIVTGRSGTVGKLHFVQSGQYWPHNTTLWVTDFFDNEPLFVYYLLQTVGIKNYGSGSGVPTLNRNHLHEHMLTVPERREQQSVARFFENVSDMIDALDKSIVQLRNHKAALMQQLFPSLDELDGPTA